MIPMTIVGQKRGNKRVHSFSSSKDYYYVIVNENTPTMDKGYQFIRYFACLLIRKKMIRCKGNLGDGGMVDEEKKNIA